MSWLKGRDRLLCDRSSGDKGNHFILLEKCAIEVAADHLFNSVVSTIR